MIALAVMLAVPPDPASMLVPPTPATECMWVQNEWCASICVDTNLDGGVDGFDVEVFYWEWG